MNPTLPNLNQAVFAPELRADLPQPALSVNTITADNVTSLHFTNDGLAPAGVAGGGFIEPITKAIVPIPAVPSLRLPPLVFSPTPTKRKEFLRESGKETPSRAFLSAVAVTTRGARVGDRHRRGRHRAIRLGDAARGLIGVRGVSLLRRVLLPATGHASPGDRRQYTQSFVMTREGTTAHSPAVIP